jgi:penicillin V acylase-like amidase (Ntn superfamily)
MRKSIAVGLWVLGLASAARDSHACSNFYFDKGGKALIAHKMDWVTSAGLVVVGKRHVKKRGFQVKNDPEFTWTSKFGSIALSMDGRESTGRGINEAGLLLLEAAMSTTQQSRDHNLPLLSVAQWTQYQLDTSETIEDVIASDNVVRIWPDDMQSHFFAWDRSGKPAVIEWLDGKMKVFRGDTLPIPVINNSAYESCVAAGDDPTGRFKTIVDGINAYDPAQSDDSISYVFSILKSVDYMLPPPTQPQWSVIFDIPASRLYLSTTRNSNVRYFDRKSFDYSCLTNVEVLDINGEGSGDVRSKFVPYTTAINRAFVEEVYNTYASYGHPTDQETIDEIIAFPDTTICMDNPPTQDAGVADASPDAGRTSDSGDASGGAGGSGGARTTGNGSSGCKIGRSGSGSVAIVLSVIALGAVMRRRRTR